MIFYFFGDNTYEMNQAIQKVKAQYTQKTQTGLDVATLDMSDASITDLLDTLAAQPMFASSRLIVVRGLGANKTAQQKYTDITSLIPKSSVVVFVDDVIDRRSSYHRFMIKQKNAREFKPLEPVQMRSWIRAQVKSLGGEIDQLTTQKLYETVAHEWRPRDKTAMIRSGQDQWRFAEEIKKLISYNPTITTSSIEVMVQANPENSIFELVETAAAGQTSKAIKIYTNLLTQGIVEQQILAMLHWQYRVITLIKAQSDAFSDWEDTFSLNPYTIAKAARLGNSLAMKQLQLAYRLMVETDIAIKSGTQPAQQAMESLIFRLSRLT